MRTCLGSGNKEWPGFAGGLGLIRRRQQAPIRSLSPFISFHLMIMGMLALMAACSGGSGGSTNIFTPTAELTFMPGNNVINITLVRVNDLVHALNITDIKIFARPSDQSTTKEHSVKLTEFNSITLRLKNNVRYTFSLFGCFETEAGGEVVQRNVTLRIDYSWSENKRDNEGNGILIGANLDRDGRADSVDDDIDGDGHDNDDDSFPYDPDHHLDSDEDEIADELDNCPNHFNPSQTDMDNDDQGDSCDNDIDGDGSQNPADLDDDGDGLIEIATHQELDAVRYALNGTGRKMSATAALDTTGCGNGDTIISCSGYELVNNISLASYRTQDNGKGWQPLEGGEDPDSNFCQKGGFSGIFEGNNWAVEDLVIARPQQDCIGLFGRIAKGGEIRRLVVIAESIEGGQYVGALAGLVNSTEAKTSKIIASRAITDSLIANHSALGGLVGEALFARIISSSAITRSLTGDSTVGGLVGEGDDATIISSFAIAHSLSDRGGDNSAFGGLVGQGSQSTIISSFAIVNSLTADSVGGLVGGSGSDSKIISSYAIANSLNASGNSVSGLVAFGSSTEIAFSYAISGSLMAATNISPLIPTQTSHSVTSSYWDNITNGLNDGLGSPQTSDALRMPTGYEGIYQTWDDGVDLDGRNGRDRITRYCDKDNDGTISTAERRQDNFIWDLGTSTEYPAIRCTSISAAEQRAWWFIDEMTMKPQLNQERLDSLFP